MDSIEEMEKRKLSRYESKRRRGRGGKRKSDADLVVAHKVRKVWPVVVKAVRGKHEQRV